MNDNYWYKITDTVRNIDGYVNARGDTVIQLGKYSHCFNDTFKAYAIVEKTPGIVAIYKHERILYDVFIFDNGPDYPSEGLFRIIKLGRIGFADTSGKIIIKPEFGCAFPFEKGIAKVAMNCVEKKADEHHTYWESSKWFYINKHGAKVEQ